MLPGDTRERRLAFALLGLRAALAYRLFHEIQDRAQVERAHRDRSVRGLIGGRLHRPTLGPQALDTPRRILLKELFFPRHVVGPAPLKRALVRRMLSRSHAVQTRSEQSRSEVPCDLYLSGPAYVEHVTVDHSSPTPAYEQLASVLRARIAAGEWSAGPLPSVKALQDEYDVGRDTVLRAIEILRSEELVFTVPRRGTYVSQGRH